MSDVPDLPTLLGMPEDSEPSSPLTLERWAELRGIAPGEILVVEENLAPKPAAPTPQPAPRPAEPSRDVPPSRQPVAGYLPRLVWSAGMTDVALLTRAREGGMPVLLYGLPGCGKTALTEAVFGQDLVTIVGTIDTDTTDLLGGWTPTGNPDEPYRWIDGPLTVAVRDGLPLLVDEIALIDPRVLSVLYSVMDGRDTLHLPANPAVGSVPVAEGFYVVGACNPDAPGASMSEALLSRFSLHLEVTTDYEILEDLGVDPDIITAASNLATLARTHEIRFAPQTRDLITFTRIRRAIGLPAALSNLVSAARPSDRKTYSDVLAGVFGREVDPLRV